MQPKTIEQRKGANVRFTLHWTDLKKKCHVFLGKQVQIFTIRVQKQAQPNRLSFSNRFLGGKMREAARNDHLKTNKQTRTVFTSVERRVIQLKWGSLGTSSY